MTIDFRDYFWGEKNNGLDVLYQNMKFSHLASKELTEFVRERSSIEEYNSKLLSKLAKTASNGSSHGTFAPFWHILKTSSEKLSSLHLQMVQRFQDLIKDINKYCDEQNKKQKQIKSEEQSTVEAVAELKDTIANLNKAKEFYNTKFLECERLKRDNANSKDAEKAEARVRKACNDYKVLIEKYGHIKEDFEKKMGVSCHHFQQIEESHIIQMKEFLTSYSQVLDSSHALMGQVHIEFKEQCNDMDVQKLLEQFVTTKGTGCERPVSITFEEADASSSNLMRGNDLVDYANGEKSKKEGQCSGVDKNKWAAVTFPKPFIHDHHKSSPNIKSDFVARSSIRASKWFLKSKRDKSKPKDRKKSKKKPESISSKEDNCSTEAKDNNSLDLSVPSSNSPVLRIDDEGYIIRPKSGSINKTIDNFYSSSDSDSEEEKEQKIRIQIKPLTNGAPISASVDELIATVGTLSLSPIPQHSRRRPEALRYRIQNRRIYMSSSNSTPEDGPIKRSVSATQNISKTENDLISVFTSSISSASTPTGVNEQNPPNRVNPVNPNLMPKVNPSADRYAALSELFSESSLSGSNDNNDNIMTKSASASTIGPPLTVSLPRPPSKRNNPTSPQLSHQSSISRCESLSSLSSDFRMTPISVGSSRGPSPLTLGISDIIPIAIAIQESVNACFKGHDETNCQVNLVGSLKIAFPAGIIQVLTNNPSPAPLVFKLNKSSKIERVFPNKELFSESFESLNANFIEDQTFEINMSALISMIRRLYEQSPNARYYNIDVLKYQIKTYGAKSTPLHLIAFWKCDNQSTNLKIDYKYNSSSLSKLEPLRNVILSVNVNGGVSAMQSRPEAVWNAATKQVIWRFDQISLTSENSGLGSIKAKFDLSSGPSTPSVLQSNFTCFDTTISGVDFSLIGLGYRVSLIKKQISTGRYICE